MKPGPLQTMWRGRCGSGLAKSGRQAICGPGWGQRPGAGPISRFNRVLNGSLGHCRSIGKVANGPAGRFCTILGHLGRFGPKQKVTHVIKPHPTPPYRLRGIQRHGRMTTSTDIYSLGVVLHEILTDHLPYQLEDKSVFEVARIICEEKP